jgi:hypothetical protein
MAIALNAGAIRGDSRVALRHATRLLGWGMVLPPVAFAAAVRLAAYAGQVQRGTDGAAGMSGLTLAIVGVPLIGLTVVAGFIVAGTWVAAVGVLGSASRHSQAPAWPAPSDARDHVLTRLTAVVLAAVASLSALSFFVSTTQSGVGLPIVALACGGPTVVVVPVLLSLVSWVRRNLPLAMEGPDVYAGAARRPIVMGAIAMVALVVGVATLFAYFINRLQSFGGMPVLCAALVIDLAAVPFAVALLTGVSARTTGGHGSEAPIATV